MRQHFPAQPEFGLRPIEQIVLPLKSRDELPPILAGLQWIWTHPALKAEIFALLEAKILAGKQATGRTGLDLWQILVLGIVRLGLGANYDRLEHLANYDTLIRQFLGVPAAPPSGPTTAASRIKRSAIMSPSSTTTPCWP